MTRHLVLFGAGVLFAVGLAVGGMTNTDKVIGFLDVSSGWDPSLALVMAGAVSVHGVGVRWAMTRPRPLFEPVFRLPPTGRVTRSLLIGSALFGAGWGLCGYCPGPALVSSVTGGTALVVAVAMSVGWAATAWWGPPTGVLGTLAGVRGWGAPTRKVD